MADTSPSSAPSHPALSAVRDENLRLIFATEESHHIGKRIIRSQRKIGIALALGIVLPMLPVILLGDDGRGWRWVIASIENASVVKWVGSLILLLITVGTFAPLWAVIRVILELKALRQYREYQREHREFLAKHNRCPVSARGYQ